MNKKRQISLIALLGLAYLVCLIAYLPAQQVLSRIPKGVGFTSDGVSGTLWSGHASTMRYQNVSLNDVEWNLAFLPLLLANLSLDVDAGNPRDRSKISVSGEITLSASRLRANRLSIYAPTQTLASLYGHALPVSPFGRTVVNLDDADIVFDGSCKTLSGDVQWLNSEVQSDFGNVSLGNFEGQLSCELGRGALTVNEANQLGLNATITHQANQRFTVKGTLKPGNDLPTNIKNMLNILGEPDSQGYLPFDF